MKKIIVLSLILSSIFIGHIEAKNKTQPQTQKQLTTNPKTKRAATSNAKKSKKPNLKQSNKTNTQQANLQYEKEELLKNCQIIRSRIASQFSGMGMGATRGGGCIKAIKDAITNYLNSVGTPTAYQLLKELEQNNFKGFI